MRTVVLTMPDEPDAVPGWLERELVGANLPRLVAELGVVHDAGGRTADLTAVLGRDRDALLAGGLAAIPRPVLSTLLTTPSLLPELQSLVFEFGGPHWDGVIAKTDLPADADRVGNAALAAIPVVPRRPARSRHWMERAVWGLAVAAAVVVAVNLSTPASGGWGFNKIAELPRDGGPKAVFAKLADLADEWNKKPTADRLALAKRLSEFRLGCSALQAADLPLPDSESRWLKGRCTAWAALLDGHLRDLDATGDVPAVRASADATAASIARELRDRADQRINDFPTRL